MVKCTKQSSFIFLVHPFEETYSYYNTLQLQYFLFSNSIYMEVIHSNSICNFDV